MHKSLTSAPPLTHNVIPDPNLKCTKSESLGKRVLHFQTLPGLKTIMEAKVMGSYASENVPDQFHLMHSLPLVLLICILMPFFWTNHLSLSSQALLFPASHFAYQKPNVWRRLAAFHCVLSPILIYSHSG